MSKVHANRFIFLPFVVLLAGILFGGVAARASESPIEIKISVASSKILVGQPIIVDCLLTNPSDTPEISIDTADTSGCQIWFDLYDATNQPIGKVAKPIREHHSLEMRWRIARAEPHQIAFVVSRAALPRTAGKYIIHAHIEMEYENEESRRNILMKEFELPFDVAPSDATLLRKTASKLCDQVEERSAAAPVAIRALVSMPEKIAYPYWLQVANIEHLNVQAKSVLMRELKLLGTKRAAMALAEMWGDENKVDRYTPAAAALIELHRTADPAVRHYIESVYFERVGKKLIDEKPLDIIVIEG